MLSNLKIRVNVISVKCNFLFLIGYPQQESLKKSVTRFKTNHPVTNLVTQTTSVSLERSSHQLEKLSSSKGALINKLLNFFKSKIYISIHTLRIFICSVYCRYVGIEFTVSMFFVDTSHITCGYSINEPSKRFFKILDV